MQSMIQLVYSRPLRSQQEVLGQRAERHHAVHNHDRGNLLGKFTCSHV